MLCNRSLIGKPLNYIDSFCGLCIECIGKYIYKNILLNPPWNMDFANPLYLSYVKIVYTI